MTLKMRKFTLAFVASLILVLMMPKGSVDASEAASGGQAHAEAVGAGHETGLPLPRQDSVLWSIVTFALFLVVLKKAAWGPLIDGLNKREAGLHQLLKDAERDREAAVKLLAEYDQKLKVAQSQVDEIIAEARRDADTTKSDIVAAAQREAEVTRKRVLEEISRAKDQAVNELFATYRANVVAATERVLVRALSDTDQKRLVDESLLEISRN